MPAPYSDNLYSAAWDDDSDAASHVDDNDINTHLSPTDGYFHASDPSASDLYPPQQESSSQSQTQQFSQPTSAGVPHVPNVLVEDPSLAAREQESSKAREAREERISGPANPASPRLPALTPSSPVAVADVGSSAGWSESTPSHTRSASATSSYPSYTPYPSTPLRSPHSHQQRSVYSERTSLFRVPADAPPAYTPSPTSPTANSPDLSHNYATFTAPAAMGVPEESARLLGHEPESMGDRPYDEGTGFVPTWKGRIGRRINGWNSRKTVKAILGVALFLSIAVALVLTILNVLTEVTKHRDNGLPDDPSHQEPDLKDPSPPPPPPPPPPGGDHPILPLPWNPSVICAPGETRFPPANYPLEFVPRRNLNVTQTIEHAERQSGWQPQVYGDIIVRRQQNNSPGPSVDVEIVSNDEDLKPELIWDSDEQRLRIVTPARVPWNGVLKPCLRIRTTVWVPEHAELGFLLLHAVNLNIQLVDNLDIKLSEVLDIATVSGEIEGTSDIARINADFDVQSPTEVTIEEAPSGYNLDSRVISVCTVSGNIHGWWPLYDSLTVSSESGSALIAVGPKPVLDGHPRPATLSVSSVSGDVQVKAPIQKAVDNDKPDTIIPPRDYVTGIATVSGNIGIWLPFTSHAELKTTSGDITATLLPVFNVSMIQAISYSKLETNTKSGNTKLTIFEPIWVSITAPDSQSSPRQPSPPADNIPYIPIGNDDPYELPSVRHPGPPPVMSATRSQSPLRCLNSGHFTMSGDIKLAYPASWEGIVYAGTVSGDITLAGKGLTITKTHSGYPRSAEARKGKYGSEINIQGISGDESLLVGEK